MARYLWVKDGIITNIVEYGDKTPAATDDGNYIVPDPGGLSVGDAFDMTDELQNRDLGRVEPIVMDEMFRLTNESRTKDALAIASPQRSLTPDEYQAFLKGKV